MTDEVKPKEETQNLKPEEKSAFAYYLSAKHAADVAHALEVKAYWQWAVSMGWANSDWVQVIQERSGIIDSIMMATAAVDETQTP